MRTLSLAVVLVLSLALDASAQEPLTSADRAPLRSEAGALLHPTLGFRLRDLGLPQRGPQQDGSAVAVGGTPTSHVWAYSQGETVVRIVLTASDAPWTFARQAMAESMRTFARLGASLRAQSDEHAGSTALLQHQGRAVMLRSAVFHDGARKFALVVTVLHPDAALARAVADSLQVPVAETARALSSGHGLPRSEIRAVIRESIAQVRACYEPRLRDRPELAGRVVVRFLVRADGTVEEASISDTTMHDALVEQCLVAIVMTLRFPPRVRGSTPVGVAYPFVFDSSR